MNCTRNHGQCLSKPVPSVGMPSNARPKKGNEPKSGLPHVALKTKRIKKCFQGKHKHYSKMPLRRSRSVRSTTDSVLSAALLDSRSASSKSLSRYPSASTITGTTLSAVEEEGYPPVPDLDKEVDLAVVVDALSIQADLNNALEKLIPQWSSRIGEYPTRKRDPNGPMCLWFKLPHNCKRRIYEFCFPPEERKITLSDTPSTEAIFPKDYFASPCDILDPVWGLLGACRAWRDEVLAYFWSQYHFHITLNEFSGKLKTPLTYIWVIPHLHLIQRLTIERDFTRLAGSHHKGATRLSFKAAHKVETFIESLVRGLLQRQGGMAMAELHIMSRKYAGFRPREHTIDASDDVPYVPQDLECPCGQFLELRGILKRCRVSGFSFGFSKSLLQALFDDHVKYSIPVDSQWPSLSPSRVVEDLNSPPEALDPGVKSHRGIPLPEQMAERMNELARRPAAGIQLHRKISSTEQKRGQSNELAKGPTTGIKSHHTTLLTKQSAKQLNKLAGGSAAGIKSHKEISSADQTLKQLFTMLGGSSSGAQSHQKFSLAEQIAGHLNELARDVATGIQPHRKTPLTEQKVEQEDEVAGGLPAWLLRAQGEIPPTEQALKGLDELARGSAAASPDQNHITDHAPHNKIGRKQSNADVLKNYSWEKLPTRSARGRSTPVSNSSTPHRMEDNGIRQTLEFDQHLEYFPYFMSDVLSPKNMMSEPVQKDIALRPKTPTTPEDEITRIAAFDPTILVVNKQNEQDPAFQRTINAMRRLSERENSIDYRNRSTNLPQPPSSSREKANLNRSNTADNGDATSFTARNIIGYLGGFSNARTPQG